ncbi:acyltransferase [Amycolatopsis antarctica]|uniref:Acyltransferase n=1 Tax=Amycolatopsis antarctica TaxID=1854586 RepID=A0A263D3T5_9PSEU|nr:acyltransferase family protein [Amycolatopsis antarctica]OZM73142.1 acyltransferase [Amycolatopsis antarctica]
MAKPTSDSAVGRFAATGPVNTPEPRKYRPELQGLRALAALLVVAYHVWLGRISGGVDVFFLVSGFLITGQLVRASARGGIRFRPMWGRMIKRLFPAALTVLLVTAAASTLLLPENRWFQTIKEIVASALYVENWRLAADSVDYFTQHDSASVVQHFWSLSIQGQFYIVWPLLIAAVALVAHRFRRDLRRGVAVVLGAAFAGSLAYSIVLTIIDQPFAYFHSLTRVWEFALGGLVALAVDTLVLPRTARIVLGWLGVVGLVSCGLVLQVGTMFPGYLALWPTLSAVFVIMAGATGSRFGADRLLSSAPLEYLGNLSYALYLWHWPVLVFYLVARERSEVGLLGGLFIVGLSGVLAAITYHLIEQPVRDSRIGVANRWGSYRFAALAMAPVLLLAGGWQAVSLARSDSSAAAVGNDDHPGALARSPGFEYRGSAQADLVPSFLSVTDDYATIDEEDCFTAERSEELVICATQYAEQPTRRIVVAGDSHAQQLIGALKPIAESRNWQIISMLRGGCPFSTESETVPGDQPCMDWNASVVDEIVDLRPDAVLSIATRDAKPGVTEYTPPGYVNQWRKVDEAGIPIVAVRDNPRYDFAPSICVELNGAAAPECATPRSEVLEPEPPYLFAADVPQNVSFLDFSDYYCEVDLCPPTIGNVLVYLDDNHINATYMTTMSPIVEQSLDGALGWNPADIPS